MGVGKDERSSLFRRTFGLGFCHGKLSEIIVLTLLTRATAVKRHKHSCVSPCEIVRDLRKEKNLLCSPPPPPTSIATAVNITTTTSLQNPHCKQEDNTHHYTTSVRAMPRYYWQLFWTVVVTWKTNLAVKRVHSWGSLHHPLLTKWDRRRSTVRV